MSRGLASAAGALLLVTACAPAQAQQRLASAPTRNLFADRDGVVSDRPPARGETAGDPARSVEPFGLLRFASTKDDASLVQEGSRIAAAPASASERERAIAASGAESGRRSALRPAVRPEPSRCAPTLTSVDVSALVRQIAREEGLDAGLADAMAQVESSHGRSLVSPKQAVGIMQLMATTGAEYGVADRCAPEQNVRGGVRYMRDLLKRYGGDVVLALGAYNAGPARVRQANGAPLYPETTKYIVSVLNRWRERGRIVATPSASDPSPAAPLPAGGWIEGHVILVE